MPPLEIIQSLIFVLRCLANNLDGNLPDLLDQVIVNGQIDQNVLSDVESLLVQEQQRDGLQIMQETLRGKIELKSDCLDNNFRFP